MSPSIKQEFIQDFGEAYQLFGLPKLMGRIVGLMLYVNKPISLGDITNQLNVSKGPVSQMVRRLKDHNLIERVWVPGDRKDFYRAVPDIFGNAFQNQMALMGQNLSLAKKYKAKIMTQIVLLSLFLIVLIGLTVRAVKFARAESSLTNQQLNFIAAVSHELRTPIATTRVLAETITRGVIENTNILVMSAAVSDFTPIEFNDRKIKKDTFKNEKDEFIVRLKRTKDILSEVRKISKDLKILGFAAETDNIEMKGFNKLKRIIRRVFK